jgi:hypothetical protein
MDISAFQLFKDNAVTSQMEWMHNTPIVSYGRIIRVIDIQTVDVEPVVQASAAKEVCTVTLLSLSSDLLEISAYPKTGDMVLLLFLQRYDKKMFAAKGTIKNRDAIGYNKFSGVGILMSTVKGFARTTVSCYENGDKPRLAINSDADASLSMNSGLGLAFCRLVAASGDESLISIIFGEGRPFAGKFLSSVLREYGFWKTPEEEWQELNAPVTERYSMYSPITKDIQGAQTSGVGLGTDKEGNPVETEAPIIETVHGKSPITKDIRSPQTITIGIGNDESGDAEEQRDAPVDITLGEKANITLTSKSGMTAHFDKAVFIGSDEGLDLAFTGKVTFSSEGDFDISFGGDGGFQSTASGLLKIGNSIATLGGMISDLLTALTNLATEGSPAAHTAKTWAAANITPLKQKWDKVFN